MKKNMLLLGLVVSLTINMAMAQTGLQLSLQTIDLGKIKQHSKHTTKVMCYNKTQNPIVLKNVSVDCNCTTVKWGRAPIMSGDSTALQVTYSADNKGLFYKAITVRATDPKEPLKIVIRGEVI